MLFIFTSLVIMVFAFGCDESSTSEKTSKYDDLRDARRSGNRGDIHREVMGDLQANPPRNVEELSDRLREMEERSR